MTNAPEIIFLPGLDGSGVYFGAFAQFLEKKYSCRLFTYPAHALSYEELTEFIHAQIASDASVIVIAESFGGPLGILVTEALGARVKALVLCATFCRPPVPVTLLRLVEMMYSKLIRNKKAGVLFNQFLFNGGSHSMAKQVVDILRALPDETVKQRLRMLASINLQEKFASLPHPVLLVKASSDRLVWKDGFAKDKRTMRIQGPHGIIGTQPLVLANIISGFIEELS